MTASVKTLCPYCGVGCGLEVVTTDHKLKVRGDREHPSSQGMICVKGATILESLHQDRLLYPLWREHLSQPFSQISWEEAMTKLVERIQLVQANYGVDAICMYGSGQFVTEDYYVAQKLIKGCLGTNNFDANSRLCMSSAVSGYLQSLGSDGPPCTYDDLELTDCAFLLGTNTAECHPIIFNRLRRHHKAQPHVKLIVVDPRRTPTAEVADLHLAINPGTDIDLLHGMAFLLWQGGHQVDQFIDHHTTGFDEFLTVIKHYPPQKVAARCGISVAELETAARYWAEAERVLSLWSMGVNQSREGTVKVRSLINLHLLTAQIGKPGAGPFSLTGQPNAMGGREAGGLAHLLPGYRSVTNPEHRAEVEHFWHLPKGRLSAERGRTIGEMVSGLEEGVVQLLWIAATNPAVSLPDLERAKKALASSPFTVYQDCYYPTETSAYAHLLLPATQWSEKTGTMTNSERRVTLCPAFQPALGAAHDDWQIFAEVGRRLGFAPQFLFTTAAEVHAEFVQLTAGRVCDMTGITYEKLRQQPLQWPYSDTEVKPDRLYLDHQFATSDGRARFCDLHAQGLAEPPDPEYPFVLTTGRLYGHWHTQTRTGRIAKIRQMHPYPFLEMHPRDARALALQEGDHIEVRSRRGFAHFPLKITRAITPGTLFVPMHWGSLWADQAEANALTHNAVDPDSFQPELKACAVQVTLKSPPAPMLGS